MNWKDLPWFVYLMAANFYLATLTLYFMFFAIPMALVVSVVAYGKCCFLYNQCLHEVLLKPNSTGTRNYIFTPSKSPSSGDQPAFKQYFYGQAVADLKATVEEASQRLRLQSKDAALRIWRNLRRDTRTTILTWPLALSSVIGLILGVAIGAIYLAAIVLVHSIIVVTLQGLAVVTAQVLKMLDLGSRYVRRITVLHCPNPNCYHKFKFAAYTCPNNKCGAMHSEMLPGSYGLIRRRCVCENKMPTLILFGSHKLDAHCPRCEGSLSSGIGTTAEFVIPFLGPPGAGKTRLMAALIAALQNGTTGNSFEFTDNRTAREYERIRPLLSSDSNTIKTATNLPRAYDCRITTTQNRRVLLHWFDAAGELNEQTSGLQQLRYLETASRFIFVIDPFSIRSFRQTLSGQTETKVEHAEDLSFSDSTASSVTSVFSAVVSDLQRMGVQSTKHQIAICVSKSDVLFPTTAPPDAKEWVKTELGLGNLVRSAEANFDIAKFFFTAAVVDGRATDTSLLPVVDWMLDGMGSIASKIWNRLAS